MPTEPAPVGTSHSRRRPRLLATALAVATVSVLLPVAAPSPAGAACAANGGNRLAGTMQGEDGRFVWSLIGVEYFDGAGRKIRADGCPEHDPGAYSQIVRVNEHKLDGHGATSGSGLTKSWSIPNVPANAATVWIEAYPMTDEIHNPQPISRVRYGHAMRRAVSLGSGTTRIDLRLPNRCGVDGGTAGAISGRFIVDGRPVVPDRVWAWNTSPDGGHYIMGWGMADLRRGWFRLQHLAANQDYVVWATYRGQTHVFEHLRVSACRDTRLDVILGSDVRDRDGIAGLVDVPVTSYFARPAAWALSKGVTTGVGGSDRFEPHRPITRGELVTLLWRTAGQPRASAHSGFEDVPTNAFYAPAVTWARNRGLTTGVGGSNRFEPTRPITRAEVAALLWRAAGSPSRSANSGFADVPANTYFAVPAGWARDRGITTGVGGSDRFEPHRSISRAEMIAMLWRSEGSPAHGRPPSPSQTCASFTSASTARAFHDLYARWGDVARLTAGGQVCPLLYGSKL
jgi:hypothetical protein